MEVSNGGSEIVLVVYFRTGAGLLLVRIGGWGCGTLASPWSLLEVYNLLPMPGLPGDLYAYERLRSTVLESCKKSGRH